MKQTNTLEVLSGVLVFVLDIMKGWIVLHKMSLIAVYLCLAMLPLGLPAQNRPETSEDHPSQSAASSTYNRADNQRLGFVGLLGLLGLS